MTNYFKELYEAYLASTSENVKRVLHGAMIDYSKAYHIGYVCYDMDMYTTLYKCAENDGERKDALNQIYSIIKDLALSTEELIDNFNEFISLSKIINKNDMFEFDFICATFLMDLKNKFDESRFEAGAGMADFIPKVPVNVAKKYVLDASQAVLDTGLDLESCRIAEVYLEKL
jgi:hypothetical protein